MSEKYNALDNMEIAKKLKDFVILELEDLRASIEYNRATDPRRSYDEDEWDEGIALKMNNLIGALNEYIGRYES